MQEDDVINDRRTPEEKRRRVGRIPTRLNSRRLVGQAREVRRRRGAERVDVSRRRDDTLSCHLSTILYLFIGQGRTLLGLPCNGGVFSSSGREEERDREGGRMKQAELSRPAKQGRRVQAQSGIG
ncbi:hypothetical protein LX36DRAFT_47576 [Colletotrichum falcatum]|nr:hypothetical protein LX36DRAFT_47576 [Colletotrichum falcatum]